VSKKRKLVKKAPYYNTWHALGQKDQSSAALPSKPRHAGQLASSPPCWPPPKGPCLRATAPRTPPRERSSGAGGQLAGAGERGPAVALRPVRLRTAPRQPAAALRPAGPRRDLRSDSCPSGQPAAAGTGEERGAWASFSRCGYRPSHQTEDFGLQRSINLAYCTQRGTRIRFGLFC